MGEPPGSRRLTDEQNTADEPGQTVTPPRGRRLQATADPRAADKRDDDPAADERTSPFPYADRFEEWVADETTAEGVEACRQELRPIDTEHVIHRQGGSIDERSSYGDDARHRSG